MKDILSRLNWPQVAALASVIGGVSLTLIFAPIDWAALPWEAIIGGTITIAGVVYGATQDRVVSRPTTPPTTPPAPPPKRVRKPTEGSVDPVALACVVAFAAAFAVAVAARGAL